MERATECDSADHGEEKIRSADSFRVQSPFLAVNSARRGFQSLNAGKVGEIVGSYDGPGRAGLVMIRVENELFTTWARDLEERTDIAYK